MKQILLQISSVLIFCCVGHSQVSGEFKSQVDNYLSIDQILVLPSIDNIDGIYARPIDRYISERIEKNHHFQLKEKNFVGSVLSPIELESNSAEAKRIGQRAKVDAMIAMSISKNKSGINIRVNLFSGKDGKLLATEQVLGIAKYEINEIRAHTGALVDKVLNRIPYKGKVLSRSANRVTIDLGTKDGLRANDIVSAIQIIKLERHPKFNFLVSSEKEVLGKIKIIKADDTIGFGVVITEKEPEAITVNTKLAGAGFVRYEESNPYLSEAEKKKLGNPQGNSNISFGKNPKEWRPVKPPVFGAAQVRFGLGGYNTGFDDGTSNDSVKKSVYPTLGLSGELWLTPNWTFEAEINQGIMELENSTGTGPSNLNATTSEYNFNISYSLLFKDDFFGPKVQFIFGSHNYRRFVDSGGPFTTTQYSGVALGLRGTLPTGPSKNIKVGIELFTHLSAKLNESPTSSGTGADSSITRYSFFAEKRYRENIWLTGNLAFKSYSTNFDSGSISQNLNNFYGGIKYLF
ncbi:MAG: hypothetical protein VX583_04635 [Bdellovibrionota bacterium]|tara:strand:+ start:22393 stop:23946 length:1554 start_codon:yes stop_codon:yes gene_type:complete